MTKSFQFSLAPEQLWQAINPWSFYNQGAQLGLVNINLGQTPHPEIEQKLLDEVGSYGRQLGRIGDALEVLIDHVALKDLSEAETDALASLKGQLPTSARSSGALMPAMTPGPDRRNPFLRPVFPVCSADLAVARGLTACGRRRWDIVNFVNPFSAVCRPGNRAFPPFFRPQSRENFAFFATA